MPAHSRGIYEGWLRNSCLRFPLFPPQADYYNHLLRRVNVTSGLVTTLAGSLAGTVGLDNYGHADGVGAAASFYRPLGVAMDGAGTFVVVVRSTMGGEAEGREHA